MGATSSKTINEQVNELAVAQVASTISNCTGSITQTQEMNITAGDGDITIGGDITQRQVATIDLSCVFSASKQSEIQRDLSVVLAQAAKAKAEGSVPNLGGTEAEIANNIQNRFKLEVTQQDEMNTMAIINQSQTMNISTTGKGAITAKGNITQEQTAELIAKAMMQSSGYMKVLDSVSTDIKQVAETESTDTFSSIAKTIGDTVKGVSTALILPFVIVGIIILMLLVVGIPLLIKKNPLVKGVGALTSRGNRSEPYTQGYQQMPQVVSQQAYGPYQYGPQYHGPQNYQSVRLGPRPPPGSEWGVGGPDMVGGINNEVVGGTVDNTAGGCKSCGCGCKDDPKTPGMCGEECPCGCRNKNDEVKTGSGCGCGGKL